MFTASPVFVRFGSNGRHTANGGWWLVMMPGLLLTLTAIAILIWPELLAYMVASVLLFAGVSLSLWGWSLRQAEKQQRRERLIYYETR
jgi:uncharacterized membrane protein HdeD (DUF308 family)